MHSRDAHNVLSVDRPNRELLKKTRQLADTIYAVFVTPDGRKVLQWMKQQSYPLIGATEQHTYANAGKREIVDLIEMMMHNSEETK